MPFKQKARAARVANLEVARGTLSTKRQRPTPAESDNEIVQSKIYYKMLFKALASIPLQMMRKFATGSRRFMDAYDRGLNGRQLRQAAWAARKYRGHRVCRRIF
jgi:hypothetical protein